MKKFARQSALAAGFAALSLASTASWAASYTYDFKTFFDTSTVFDLLDTKNFTESVASLTISDISGGIQISLTENKNSFSAKTSAGTFIDALYLSGPKGTLKSVTGTALTSGAGYSSFGITKDAGYRYNWNIDFASNKFAEGTTSVVTILGSGVTAASFAKAGSVPMIDLSGVGKPYNGLLGLNTTVHFIGKLSTAAVPEPTTYALMGLGLVGISLVARRRAK